MSNDNNSYQSVAPISDIQNGMNNNSKPPTPKPTSQKNNSPPLILYYTFLFS
ncbi:MAG: hypothetical protein ACRC0S_02205 [Fusobacteriaceae bacterium]